MSFISERQKTSSTRSTVDMSADSGWNGGSYDCWQSNKHSQNTTSVGIDAITYLISGSIMAGSRNLCQGFPGVVTVPMTVSFFGGLELR
jgi:hypothetical protein